MGEIKSSEIVVGRTENNNPVYHKGQTVYFINVLDNPIINQVKRPEEKKYDISNVDFSILLNYYPENISGTNISQYQGLSVVYNSSYQTIDLFKKEVMTENGIYSNYILFNEPNRYNWSLNDAQNFTYQYIMDGDTIIDYLYYISPSTNEYKPIQNYKEGTDIRNGDDGIFTSYYPVLYKRIQEKTEIVSRTLTPLKLVKENIKEYSIQDFNVSNKRKYQYVFYPLTDGDQLIREEKIVSTKWDSWSITELHPIDSTHKKYYADNDDIWIFNLNVETGEQVQNIAKSENITLGTYPRYSQGLQNRVSGQVTCLMGTDVIPLTYLESGKALSFSPFVRDGYNENRFFNIHPTSNERVDMLKAWRKLVYSKNPKLLKDRKGQSFIVTITASSNKPFDNIKNQPDTISFSWSEIQSMDGVVITNIKE